eukprot:gene21954-biopygen9653
MQPSNSSSPTFAPTYANTEFTPEPSSAPTSTGVNANVTFPIESFKVRSLISSSDVLQAPSAMWVSDGGIVYIVSTDNNGVFSLDTTSMSLS